MGGHGDGSVTGHSGLAKPRDEYPASQRHGFGDYLSDYLMYNINFFGGFGTKWWDPVATKLYAKAYKPDWSNYEEHAGPSLYRELDHIGERSVRKNKLPMSAMVDAERGNYEKDKNKTNYCMHIRYHQGYCEKYQSRNKDAHCKHMQHLFFNCEKSNNLLQMMEWERFRRLNEAGVVDAVLEKSKRKSKFPLDSPMTDWNRFRDDDNSWKSYYEKKKAGEFLKNPQKTKSFLNSKGVYAPYEREGYYEERGYKLSRQ